MTSLPIPCCQTILLPRSKSMQARKLCINFIEGKPIQVSEDCDDIYYLSTALVNMCSRKNNAIQAGESATALRFLTAIAAARPDTFTVIDAAPQLRRRPVAPLVDALRSMGASIDYMNKDGYAPLRISGRQLTGGTVDFTGTGSSQYASACLLISSMTTDGIEVIKRDKASMPYLDMTRQMLLNPCVEIEPDWSAASYFYEWTALCGQQIKMPHLRPFGKSCQGDARAMLIFRTLFNVITKQHQSGLVIQLPDGAETPAAETCIDMADCPDLVPAVAMTMAMKGIRGTLTGLNALRIKETDRLKALSEVIAICGGKVETAQQKSDYQMHILGEPDPLPGDAEITVNPHGDHRIAMCAIAALSSQQLRRNTVDIMNTGCIDKSFPAFLQRINQLKSHLFAL